MEPGFERLAPEFQLNGGIFMLWVGGVFLAGVFSLVQSRMDDFHAETETLLKILGTGWISERTTGDGGEGEQREGTTWTVTSSCGCSAPSRASRDGRGPSRLRGLLPRLWCRGRFTVSALARGVKLFLLILTGLCLLGRSC